MVSAAEQLAANLNFSALGKADELKKRKASWRQPERKYERGYGAIFAQHVRQADEGCDFDFLEGTAPIPEPEIH